MLQNQTPQPQYSMQQKNLSCPQPCLNFQYVLPRTELLLLLANGKFSFSADVKDSQQKFDLLKALFWSVSNQKVHTVDINTWRDALVEGKH